MAGNEVKSRTVYLLCNENSDLGCDTYVGSTSQTLAKRLASHKSACSKLGNEENKLYKCMREVGPNNWFMRPLLSQESTMCSSDDIRAFEKMWCKVVCSDLNTKSPIRSDAEKREKKDRTVYLLSHKNSDLGRDVYVGSSSLPLAKRLTCHKSACSKLGNDGSKLYKRMREVGPNNWFMRPLLSLESTICSSDDIRAFQRMWCEVVRSDLNAKCPSRLEAEYREKNKEVIGRKQAERYHQNKEVICRKQAERNQQNKEVICRKQAERYQKNRDKICLRKAERQRQNRNSKKFFCEVCVIACVCKSHLERHN